jgi:AraC-like DNA-binding protein
MIDFFKYLTSNPEDKQWGITLNVVGKAKVIPGANYPASEHPSGYLFNWNSGRILSEYQINYITEGSGILETQTTKYKVKAGTVMLIKPELWHRYKPDKEVGWTENYIGLEGDIVKRLFKNQVLNSKSAIIECGLNESVLDCYYRIFELAQKEKPGYQLIASGIAIRLLGSLVSHVRNKEFKGTPLEIAMEDAKFKMRNQLDQDLDFTELAASLNLGYSYFRKMFKKNAGVSPGQYHLHLRLMRAKELLLASDMPIKQVAFETGFDSVHYFSRLFKNKIGAPPSEVRNNNGKPNPK